MKRIVAFLMMFASVCIGDELAELNDQIIAQLPAFTNAPSRDSYRILIEFSQKMIKLNELDSRGYEYLITLNKCASGSLFPESTAERKQQKVLGEFGTAIWAKLQEFKDNPNKQDFEALKGVIEKFIELDELSPYGYLQLSSLYSSATGVLMDKRSGLEATIKVLKQYQAIHERKGDLSEQLELYTLMLNNYTDSEKLRIATEQMIDWEEQPECVVEARKLFDQYLHDYGHNNAKAQESLDSAITVLKKGLMNDSADFKIYIQLYNTYAAQRDYINAYAMWQLACQFTDTSFVPILNATTDMYLQLIQYADGSGVSEESPGGNYQLYFLWLNRENIISALTPEFRAQLDDTLEKAKQKAIERLDKEKISGE